jgi:two-component system cell cycle sensor histidine kinase/response regulator CckA
MDGPTLLKELRKLRPDIKFVFVSGYAEDAFAKNLPSQEQYRFLAKPFTLKQLVAEVKDTLAGEGSAPPPERGGGESAQDIDSHAGGLMH